MKKLQNKPNVTPPGGDYSYGTMRDDTGSDDGSRANTEFMTDYVQFFERLMDKSGIPANGLPDNDANGYQLYEAFRKIARPYKVYSVQISQIGTGDPTVEILGPNEIGTIVWTRNAIGKYLGTLTNAFPEEKTFLFINSGTSNGLEAQLFWSSANQVVLDTSLIGVPADNVLINTSLEIRVYDDPANL